MRVVLASSNAGKRAEFAALLADAGIELIAQSDLGIADAEETGLGFVENALLKARHAARVSGLPALADDSGLCVPALGGAPGVYSARYGGEPKSDARNNDKLLADLAALGEQADRRAHFFCVLVLLRHAQDPQPLIVEGEWHGEILHAARGAGGFGYDSLFLVPGLGLSSAELPAPQKNALSHRGQALAHLIDRLRSGQ